MIDCGGVSGEGSFLRGSPVDTFKLPSGSPSPPFPHTRKVDDRRPLCGLLFAEGGYVEVSLGVEQGGADIAAGSEGDLVGHFSGDAEFLDKAADFLLGRIDDGVLHPPGLKTLLHLEEIGIAGANEGAVRREVVGL